jgi:hypothetical protein
MVGVKKSFAANDLCTRGVPVRHLEWFHELPTPCGSTLEETAMTMFHQLRSPLIATVAAVTLVLAGHASRHEADGEALDSAPAASVAPAVERSVSEASPVAMVQLQSDLDLVGASIGTYDR